MTQLNWLVKASSLLAGILAGLALWSWSAGVGDLFTSAPEQIPMAPSTALLLALMSLAVFLFGRWPAQAAVIRFDYGTAGLVALSGFLAFTRPMLGWGSPVENFLAQTTECIGNLPLGQMSPLTGAAFVAVATALLLRLPPQGQPPAAHWVSVALAGAVLLVGAGVAVSYGLGKPWLYHGSTIPMALWTAIAFIFLSLALLGRPSAHPRSVEGAASGSGGMPLAISGLLALGIGILGAVYLRHEQAQNRAEARELLKAISDLKARQIADWRKERLADVRFFAQAAFVARDFQALLHPPASPEARAEVLHWLTLLKGENRYAQVAVYDTNFVPRVTVPEGAGAPSAHLRELMADALRTGEVMMSDLHREGETNDIHLDLVLPVFASAAPSAIERAGSLNPQTSTLNPRQPLGVVLLRLDPRQYLYPLIQSWLTPSRSGETVLFRREGDEVVFLNELRHQTNTALNLRRPIEAQSRLPAAVAASGHFGQVDGMDYRNVPVLTTARPVPNTPWFIIAKVDRDEIYAPLRQQAWLTLALTAILAVAAGVMVRLIWQRRETAYAQQALASEQQRRLLAERVEHLMMSANDAIILANEHWKILEANDRALETYGYSVVELQAMSLPDLCASAARAEFPSVAEQLKTHGHGLVETLHQRKNGATFPVDISSRLIELGGVRCCLDIIRDITQRKAQEREIERLTRLYATLSRVNQSINRVESRDELFREICRIAVEVAGFKLVWIGVRDPATPQVRPAASAGDNAGYLDQIKVYADDRPEGRGPVGTCLREARSCIVNAFASDARTVPWHDAALAHGLQAVAALPIRFHGEVCAALTVYAGEPGVFQDKEIALLKEMALDISLALDQFDLDEQRRQAQRALADREEHLRTILETTREGFWLVDTQGRFLEVNEAYCAMSGYAREELLQMRIPDVEGLATAEETAARMQRIMHQGLDRFDTRHRRKDGSLIDVEVSLNFLDRGGGRVVCFCRDITWRKQAEATLRESEDRYRRLFEMASDAIVLVENETGQVLEANHAAVTLYGYSREEWLQRKNTDVSAEPDETRRATLDQQTCIPVRWHRKKDGTVFPVEITASHFESQDRRVHIAGIRDMTEHLKAEELLQQRVQLQDRLTQTAVIVPGMIYSFRLRPDGSTSMPYASAAVEQIFGLQPEAVIEDATPAFSSIHPDDLGPVNESIAESAEALTPWREEFRVRHPRLGVIWVEGHSVPQREADESIIWHGFIQDITARKQAEHRQAAMHVELQQAQKLESIGRLAAGIAHEINTPTQFIGDNTRFVRDAFDDLKKLLAKQQELLDAAKGGPVPPALVAEVECAIQATDLEYLSVEIPKALDQSLEGIARVTNIVRAMKDFSHPGSAEKTLVELNKAIESTVTVCRNEWKYVADLVMDFDPNLPAVPCLVGEFNQVILNLVINAAYAIADVVGDGGQDKGTIRVSTRRDGDWAEVRVQDTGKGIPENVRCHLFEPFFTTKPLGKGTGQGLAIARSVIVDKHGGTLTFETEVGQGTTFILRLPIKAAAVTKPPEGA